MSAEARSPGDEESAEPPVRYEIRVRGVLDPHWSAWFDGLAIGTGEPGQTVLAGPVADQAALHGLLTKIRDLGLPLLSLRQVGPDQPSPPSP